MHMEIIWERGADELTADHEGFRLEVGFGHRSWVWSLSDTDGYAEIATGSEPDHEDAMTAAENALEAHLAAIAESDARLNEMLEV